MKIPRRDVKMNEASTKCARREKRLTGVADNQWGGAGAGGGENSSYDNYYKPPFHTNRATKWDRRILYKGVSILYDISKVVQVSRRPSIPQPSINTSDCKRHSSNRISYQ